MDALCTALSLLALKLVGTDWSGATRDWETFARTVGLPDSGVRHEAAGDETSGIVRYRASWEGADICWAFVDERLVSVSSFLYPQTGSDEESLAQVASCLLARLTEEWPDGEVTGPDPQATSAWWEVDSRTVELYWEPERDDVSDQVVPEVLHLHVVEARPED